jgi:hypothetical protein
MISRTGDLLHRKVATLLEIVGFMRLPQMVPEFRRRSHVKTAEKFPKSACPVRVIASEAGKA